MCVRIMLPHMLGLLSYHCILFANLVLTFCATALSVACCHAAHLYVKHKASANDILHHIMCVAYSNSQCDMQTTQKSMTQRVLTQMKTKSTEQALMAYMQVVTQMMTKKSQMILTKLMMALCIAPV